MQTCPDCGAEMAAGDTVCVECGAAVDDGESPHRRLVGRLKTGDLTDGVPRDRETWRRIVLAAVGLCVVPYVFLVMAVPAPVLDAWDWLTGDLLPESVRDHPVVTGVTAGIELVGHAVAFLSFWLVLVGFFLVLY